MHLADTRDQAIEDCTYGLQDFANYFGAAGFVPLSNTVEGDPVRRASSSQSTPQGATAASAPPTMRSRTSRTCSSSPGGFGTLLLLGHDWANPQATYHSYELFARKVIPHFKGQLAAPRASHDWAKGMRDQLFGQVGQAIVNAITEHTDEQKREGAN